MFSRLIADGFAKVTVLSLLVLLAITSYLCVENKANQAKLAIVKNELVQQQQANSILNTQLEKANQQITNYFILTKDLQQKVLTQLQHKREKTDEILQILEQHKNWSSQPVPGSVSRLFKPNSVQGNGTKSATLSHRKSVPNTKPND